jgi:uncharacterized protein (DUF1684 family)
MSLRQPVCRHTSRRKALARLTGTRAGRLTAAAVALAAACHAAETSTAAAAPAAARALRATVATVASAATASTAVTVATAATTATGARATPAPPAARAATPPADAYRREIESWRGKREADLKDPNGWLTLVGLFWLEQGDNRFGSGPRNRVVLPAGKAPTVAGTLVRRGDAVTVRAEPGSGLASEGRPVTEMALNADAKGKPTVLRLGTLSFFVIKRGDRLGVRVKDASSPALAAFHGLASFPVDPGWRLVARFEPHPRPKSIPIANVLGMTDNEPSPGIVVFEHGGKTYRLDALAGGDDGSLFLVFADQTTGRETYGAGRFLDTDPPRNGEVVVDFNKAYNPPCAFTAFATCPLPPPQNRLAAAVTAGEKKYGEGHH